MSITPEITLGYEKLFHIDASGRVSAWGNNSERLCDIPADLPPVTKVVCTFEYAIALCHDGTLRAWGTDGHTVNTTFKNVRDITTEFAIMHDGRVARLVPFEQMHISVQTANGKYKNIVFKDQMPKSFKKPVTRIWNLNDDAYAIHPDGTMTKWQESYETTPDHRRVAIPDDLPLLSAYTPHIKLYDDGHLAGWNDQRMVDAIASIPHRDFVDLNEHFALRATGELVPMPTADGQPNPLHNVPVGLPALIQIDAYDKSMVALTRDGRIAIWGEKSDTLNPPLPVNDPTIAEIAATRGMVVIRYANGRVKIWDKEFYSFDDFIEPGEANIISVAASLRYSGNQWDRQYIALDDQGNVHTDDHSWELEFEENYIAPEENGYITPAAVQGNTTAVFATDRNFYAVLKDATKVYGWGGRSIRPIKSPKPVKQIVGNGDTLAILYHDGTVRVNRKEGFEPPANLGPVKSITASDTHILALLEDGTVVAWGDNELGACDVPADLGPVVQVAVGDDFSVVLCDDGSVRSWGENGEGQYTFPADLPKVRQISTSFYETYVLTESGSVIKSHRPSIFDVPDALRV